MRIFITQPISTEAIDLLQSNGYEVVVSAKKMTKEEIITAASGCDAIISMVNDKIDQDVINSCKNLKVIANFAVGFDNIDIKSATEKKIFVANAPGVSGASVAELVFASLFAFSRKLIEADRYIREGNFREWTLNLFVGNELQGKKLGIVGFGQVGQALVPLAKALGMKIIYANKSGELARFKMDKEIACNSLPILLTESDYVVLAVPLNEATKHLITLEELKLMKKNAVLVNVARGPVVSELDLVEALESGLIKGACLDVYEFEPNISEKLINMPNTVLTPHIGSATKEARTRMALLVVNNVINILSGKPCPNIINNVSI